VKVLSLLDLPNFVQAEETAETFQENALLKARALWDKLHEPVFADDSGLEVDALGGRPGVRSMRYSEPDPTHEKNIDKLLLELSACPEKKRTARFRCAIIFIDEHGKDHLFEGTVEGVIGFERQGRGGFGYDPVFCIPEKKKSLAELSSEEKNEISHRGRAVQKLKEFLNI
jgi:XTP/dITP diphosphohydrolase